MHVNNGPCILQAFAVLDFLIFWAVCAIPGTESSVIECGDGWTFVVLRHTPPGQKAKEEWPWDITCTSHTGINAAMHKLCHSQDDVGQAAVVKQQFPWQEHPL